MPQCLPRESGSAREVELVRAWIGAGAPWPDELSGVDKVKKTHWAFWPRCGPRCLPPKCGGGAEPDRPFHSARLEAEGLKLSPEADRVTLLRRLILDLIGLPPTIAEVDAFLADTSAGRLRASSSSGCWPRRITANAGAGTGSTRPATPTRDGYEKDKPRQRLVLSRLGHRRLQSRPALRPVHHRATGRRPAARRRRRTRSWPPASCAIR